VIGIEGDGNWSSYKKTSYNSYEKSYYSSQWDWFATIRARAGLAVGNTLIYGTAGVAFVESKNNLWYPGSGYYCGYYQTCFGASTNTGFTAGVGAEYMVSGNWSVKAEYLYINLPSKSFTDMTGPNNISFKDDAHIARLGINYHFR
jgi:outer membrane immunogenic protein